MKSAPLLSLAVLAVAWTAAPAWADDGRVGFSSSASTTITVIIPPIQAGFDASREGAVGLWTLAPGASALMVKMPDTVSTGQSSSLDVFRSDGNVFDVNLPAGSGFRLTSAASSENKGLMRQSYTLSSEGPSAVDSVQVFIRGI